jgi:hypothetical protein
MNRELCITLGTKWDDVPEGGKKALSKAAS